MSIRNQLLLFEKIPPKLKFWAMSGLEYYWSRYSKHTVTPRLKLKLCLFLLCILHKLFAGPEHSVQVVLLLGIKDVNFYIFIIDKHII
jgi:hypothetical protein